MRTYYICTPQDFITKCILIFIVNEIKNFVANNVVQVAGVSHVLGSVQKGQSQIEDLCIKGENALQDQVELVIGVKVQLQVGVSGQTKIVGKIPYTCNRLIVDYWILESGGLIFSKWGFCLARGFPYSSTNH